MLRSIIGTMFLLSALVLGGSAAQADSKRLTVVAILPLTGNAADQGEWARRGIEIAASELKSKQAAISITYEDSKGGDVATAVQAYKRLTAVSKPDVVLTWGSGVAMALSPLTNADRVIQVGVATGTPKYSSPEDFTFRTFPSSELESEHIVKEIKEKLNVDRVAVLHINNDYGVGSASTFSKLFRQMGGTILNEQMYNPGETDFKPQLLRLKELGPTTVFIASYPADGAILLKQARSMGIKAQFIASAAIAGGKDFFSVAGEAAEGIIVAASRMDNDSMFAKSYDAQFPGDSPAQQVYAARAYDALQLVSQAALQCSTISAECIRDELFKVKDYPGASGVLTFDRKGDVVVDFDLFRIHRGAFFPLS